MVARGGVAQQRNPGKEENIYWNPVRGGIMRGFNIYSSFPCNTIDNKRTTTGRNPLCHPSGVPIDGCLTRGSAANAAPPPGYFMAPCRALKFGSLRTR